MTMIKASHQGDWKGVKRLYLSGTAEPDHACDSALRIVALTDSVLELSYGWDYEQKAHQGKLLVGCAPEALNGAWVDTWHQSKSLLQLSGSQAADGNLHLLGSYPAGEGPDWGWRIELAARDADKLYLRMVNITPDGAEMTGVEMEYQRH